jgi:hypothetical protein
MAACDECSSIRELQVCILCDGVFCRRCRSPERPDCCQRDWGRDGNILQTCERLLSYLDKHNGEAFSVEFTSYDAEVRSEIARFECSIFPTLLNCAAYNGIVPACQLLLEAGADANKVTANGKSPLSRAICHGDVQLVELLLRHGAEPNETHPRRPGLVAQRGRRYTGRTPMAWVILSSLDIIIKKQMISQLLDHGADINHPNSIGTTPLFWAIVNNDHEMLEFLLENGADPRHRNNRGEDAMARARSQRASFEIRRRLTLALN